MFESLYAPLPDTAPYMERLGLADLPLRHDLETLNRLLSAHVQRIPFENLDAYAAGRVPSLAVRDLYDKIILHRRGGWCHELNALLYAFLSALGFSVYSVGARVLTKGFVTPIGHHGVVCVLDGRKYYCDVGFGDIAVQSAVALDGTPSPFGFRMEKRGDWYVMLHENAARTRELLTFADVVYEPVDFLYANYASATDENESFRNTLYVSIMDGETRLLLRGGTLTATCGGVRTVLAETADPARLQALLTEYFGIRYPLT